MVTSSFDGTAAVHEMCGSSGGVNGGFGGGCGGRGGNGNGGLWLQNSYSLAHPGRVVHATWNPAFHSVLACTDSSVIIWV